MSSPSGWQHSDVPPAWQNQNQADDFSDLDGFGGGYRPEQQVRAGLDALADGDYDFEIVDAALARAGQKQDRILRVNLRTNTGALAEHTYWLNDQAKVNALGADCCVLGLPAEKWGQPGYELSKVLPALPGQLRGRKFRGAKRSRKGEGQYEGKVYHNLHVNALIGGAPMPTSNGTHTAPPPPQTASQGAGAPPPPKPPTPAAGPEWWLLNAQGQPVQATRHDVQRACDQARDAARVQVCRVGTSEWRTADQCGFQVIPF